LQQKIDVNAAILELEYEILTMETILNKKDDYLKFHYRMYSRFESDNISNLLRSGSVNDPYLMRDLWKVKNLFDSLNRQLDQTIDRYNAAPNEEQRQNLLESLNKDHIEKIEEVLPSIKMVLCGLKSYEKEIE